MTTTHSTISIYKCKEPFIARGEQRQQDIILQFVHGSKARKPLSERHDEGIDLQPGSVSAVVFSGAVQEPDTTVEVGGVAQPGAVGQEEVGGLAVGGPVK